MLSYFAWKAGKSDFGYFLYFFLSQLLKFVPKSLESVFLGADFSQQFLSWCSLPSVVPPPPPQPTWTTETPTAIRRAPKKTESKSDRDVIMIEAFFMWWTKEWNLSLIVGIRVTSIVGLPPRLTSFWIISSQILHFLPAQLAGWNN